MKYVLVLSQGFGVAAKSTQECRHTDPMTIVCFHQADIGEYIRSEAELTWYLLAILKTVYKNFLGMF